MKLYEIGSVQEEYGRQPQIMKTMVRRLYADYIIRRIDSAQVPSVEFYRNLPDGSTYLYASYQFWNMYVEEADGWTVS